MIPSKKKTLAFLKQGSLIIDHSKRLICPCIPLQVFAGTTLDPLFMTQMWAASFVVVQDCRKNRELSG